MLFAANAHAQSVSSLWRGDRSNPDFVRPNLNDGKTYPEMTDDWTPAEWTESKGSTKAVIEGFYQGGLITDQYMQDNIPVIEVGPNFMHLSSRDKNRVAAYIDHVQGYTRGKPGMFYIYYPVAKKPFGVYTKRGLELQ